MIHLLIFVTIIYMYTPRDVRINVDSDSNMSYICDNGSTSYLLHYTACYANWYISYNLFMTECVIPSLWQATDGSTCLLFRALHN